MVSSNEVNVLEAPVLVMVPCYNESGAVAGVLRDVHELGDHHASLVIDDGSSDDTFGVASQLSPAVRLVDNLGIGGAVQTAIKYAHREGYGFCVQIDGDGQHPAGELATLRRAYAEEPANILIGSRYIEDEGFQSSAARRLGSRIIGAWLGLLFGQRITDSTSGLRLMDADAIRFFAHAYPYDFPEPISIAWALRHGLTVREVPVRMRERHHGSSSITGPKTIAYMIRVMGYIALARLERVQENRMRRARL